MIREETNGPARFLTLARPDKKNALSRDVLRALGEAVRSASADPSVRAIVINAEGSVFASGGDLDELAAIVDKADGADDVLAMGVEMAEILACPIPVIAAIGGDVYGGGCELVLQCDLSLMETQTKLSFRHARMGLSPAWGGTARLLERIGPTLAARMLFTSELVGAHEAAALGLVTKEVPTGASTERALAIAIDIAKAERDVIATHKALLRDALLASRNAVKSEEDRAFKKLWGAEAHRAAMSRFAAGKRPR